jgi:addiction module HigA family antidote
MNRQKKKLAPVHPGEVLREEFIKPLGLSPSAVARGLGVAPSTVNLLLRGQRSVSAELALRLSRYVGTTAEFWVGLQGQYDLDVAQDEAEDRIAREVHRCPLVPVPA